MPIYVGGVNPDGTQWAKEFEGYPVSSCGEFWSTEPFTPEREKAYRRIMRKKRWKERLKKLK